MVTLTSAAAAQIRSLVAQDGRPGVGLRIFIDKGGCSGLQYNMTIDAPQEGDQETEFEGAKLFIDRESAGYLAGSTIDFEDGLTNTGFRIRNPNAKQTCGCGTSFEA
jgi:iron-sulfur cluster assembly accessory protein